MWNLIDLGPVGIKTVKPEHGAMTGQFVAQKMLETRPSTTLLHLQCVCPFSIHICFQSSPTKGHKQTRHDLFVIPSNTAKKTIMQI